MKSIHELNQNRLIDIQRAEAASANTSPVEHLEGNSQSVGNIIHRDLPIGEDFYTDETSFKTGEPLLGKNKDIIGTQRTHYVSNQILGRLF